MRIRPTLAWAALSASMLLGCRGLPSDARWLRPEQVGDPTRARSVGLMDMAGGGSEARYLPNGQAPETIQDEVTLTKFGPTQICLEMLVRSPQTLDHPVADWDLSLNGRSLTGLQRMNLVEGTTANHDYPVVQQVNVVKGWVPAGSFAINVPREGVFTVVERRATLCVPRADIAGDAVWISIALEDKQPGGREMDRKFGWKIVEAAGQVAPVETTPPPGSGTAAAP